MYWSIGGNMPKFGSKPITEHAEVPLADEGQWEEVVDYWTERKAIAPAHDAQESASYVVSVGQERDPHVRAAQLGEIVALVQSQGGRVVGQEICYLSQPNPRTLLGKGTAQEIASRARTNGATMLVLDAELSPSQTRNLEDLAGMPICDREAIILNVFLAHAKTRRARIQVEIAQLEYLRPRIRGMGLDMDQQTGGMTKARGPGETASELMARKLDGRLEELKKALDKLETSSRTQRRQRGTCKRMVLVGYTNAGKTSLMNALTQAGLSAKDMPFETLDTTSRCLTRHGGDVLMSDTVGFIRRLPERLMASFESTLAEITEASLLVIVVDTSDYERDLHLQTTQEILEKLGAGNIPRFYVFNKIDRIPEKPEPWQLDAWSDGYPWAVVSAHDAIAVAELEQQLLRAVRSDEEEMSTFVPYAAGSVLSLVYGKCRVLSSSAENDGLEMRIQGPTQVLYQIRNAIAGGTR
ncbi:MAG TPA: GTPase HflX [Polyangium sp.]|nr:GTPase HflX [Polyangium sp.]